MRIACKSVRTVFIAVALFWGIGVAATAALGQERQEEPLNVYIRAGEETHGPGEHNYPAFLERWLDVLRDRGIEADGGLGFPDAERLAEADVLLMYCQDGVRNDRQRALVEEFIREGGNLVVLHSAVDGYDSEWFKGVAGGAWDDSSWQVDEKQGVYFQDDEHPITRGVSNFDLPDEEVYWDLALHEDIHVLATSFHDIRIIAPQMWTYKGENHRAFVWLTGHVHTTFEKPHVEALLLRGIAWAAGRDADTYLTEDEVAMLRYPPGGPVRPEKAHEPLEIHPEFELSLMAAEPDVVNPIDLTWDGQGRLWVAETPEYPAARDEANPRDRISILEDSTGDGRLDEKTVFYEGLNLVTSLALYKDGVLVAQAPDILRLRDTDGDDRADTEELVLTGFGTGDTHAVVNHLRWGPDGWVYATLGYSRADLRNAEGQEFGHFTEGVIRFRPDGSDVQAVSTERGGNTWGVGFTAEGELFWSQATSGRHLYHTVLPEWALQGYRVDGAQSYSIPLDRYLELRPIMKETRPAYVQVAPTGGFTAAIGATPYTGRSWPEPFWNSIFVSEPTIWLTHRDRYWREGITFKAEPAREEAEFLAGRDLWFCPIGHRIAPDGSMYLVDFYNQAVSHNDIRVSGEYHDDNNQAIRPDRDRTFGRIWRVDHAEASPYGSPALADADGRELVEALTHPNRWFRATAQRLLVEGGHTETTDSLDALLGSEAPGHVRMHALWALELMEQLDPETLVRAVTDNDPTVRWNAMRAVSERAFKERSVAPAVRKAIQGRITDDDPRAQLEALVALGSGAVTDSEVAEVIDLYPSLGNRWARSAAFRVASQLPETAIEQALKMDEPGGLVDLVGRLAERAVEADGVEAAARLVRQVAEPSRQARLQEGVLQSLAGAVPEDKAPEWSDNLSQAFRRLLDHDDRTVVASVLPLVLRWDREDRLSEAVDREMAGLGDALRDSSMPQAERLSLARSLLAVRPVKAETIRAVGGMLSAASDNDLKRRIIEALGEVDHPAAGRELVAAYPGLTPSLQPLALDRLLQREEWARQLIEAIRREEISPGMLGASGRQRLRQHPSESLASAAEEALDQVSDSRKEVDGLIAKLIPQIRQGKGDPENGRQIFQACLTCHTYEDEGREVGPDLTGVGANNAELLLSKILAPNRSSDPSYHTYIVETEEGRTHMGMIAREESDRIVLRNQAGEVEIPREEIASMRSTGQSLMPEGFASLGADNLLDLIAYLRQDDENYRTLDLTSAYTTSTSRGMWAGHGPDDDQLDIREYGTIHVDGVPFYLSRPNGTPTGKNAIVLRGGEGYAKTLPRKVDFEVGLDATKLHFLGGIAGWGYPFGSEEGHDVPVLKATIHYADGETEELVMHNGDEFADYVARHDVPGSEWVEGVVGSGQQVRWFTKDLEKGGVIERIELSSYDNHVAPTLLAMTAELRE